MNAHIINKVSNDTIDEAEISIVYRQVASGGGGGGLFPQHTFSLLYI